MKKIKRRKRKDRVQLTPNQKILFAEIGRYALGIALIGGTLAIILTAPNLLQVLGPVLKKYDRWGKEEKLEEADIEKLVNKLYKDRLIKTFTKKGKTFLQITNRGRRQLIEYNIDAIEIKKQKWDSKWRIVIFDIPEKMRIARDVLRFKLKEIGFIKMQKSVWVAPYECENEINFIASTYGVERFVNYAVCEKLDNAKSLKKIFGL
jgi:hypothetical protein